METTYTIEFMRLAEPPLASIKQPSAFHVAYYCNLRVPLRKRSSDAHSADPYPVRCCFEAAFMMYIPWAGLESHTYRHS